VKTTIPSNGPDSSPRFATRDDQLEENFDTGEFKLLH
jgi:hypothetical protein